MGHFFRDVALLIYVLFRELARERVWSRIHLVPLLLAEGDRDTYRRKQAALEREREIMKDVKGWEVTFILSLSFGISFSCDTSAGQVCLSQPQTLRSSDRGPVEWKECINIVSFLPSSPSTLATCQMCACPLPCLATEAHEPSTVPP